MTGAWGAGKPVGHKGHGIGTRPAAGPRPGPCTESPHRPAPGPESWPQVGKVLPPACGAACQCPFPSVRKGRGQQSALCFGALETRSRCRGPVRRVCPSPAHLRLTKAFGAPRPFPHPVGLTRAPPCGGPVSHPAGAPSGLPTAESGSSNALGDGHERYSSRVGELCLRLGVDWSGEESSSNSVVSWQSRGTPRVARHSPESRGTPRSRAAHPGVRAYTVALLNATQAR